jgi:L-fucose isomerase-like protein
MTQPSSTPMTLGVIVGNRGFFPDHLARSGRMDIVAALTAKGIRPIILDESDSKFGAVETRQEAARCADLFKKHREQLDGIVVTLPNFGDERAIAETIRMANLGVPILMQATPDTPSRMTIRDRRDSFCGKMSACNNLAQYGIPYSLTTLHTEALDSDIFRADLDWFLAVCRVVKGLKKLRIGAIGARPAAFNTVRYSEKILESAGISVETLDLSEVLGRIGRLKDDDGKVVERLRGIRQYVSTNSIPDAALVKMAKLGTVMSDQGLSSACEVDVAGVIGMHALQLASQTPSALLDWNNNYADDPDKAVCFHCSNLPKHFFKEFRMDFQEIIAGTVGKENTFGTVVGRVKSGPMSFARFSTNDREGKISGYVGEGAFTEDSLETFGGAGVVRIPQLQKLLRFICERGFEHHVAANFSTVASAVCEAATRYLRWDIYWHKP